MAREIHRAQVDAREAVDEGERRGSGMDYIRARNAGERAAIVRNIRARDAEVRADERAKMLNRLTSLADGFHFAGNLDAEKSLRGWIKETNDADT